MAKEFIAVRDVDEEIYRRFKARAVRDRLKLGIALTRAMENWLQNEKTQRKDLRNLLKIKPIDFGPGSEKLSENIDKILYGLKKRKK